jgi:hypothetical protein
MGSKWLNFFRWTGNILRYEGLWVLSWRLLRRALRPLGNMELVTFFEKDLTQPLREVRPSQGIVVSLARPSDIDTLVKLMEERHRIIEPEITKEFKKLVLSRFQRGGLCFLGKTTEEEIVHYNWVSFNREQTLEGRMLHLEPDEAYCLDAFTLREWRGHGIYPFLHYHALRVLKENGIRKAYTLVDADNKSSQKTHVLQAWKPLGTVLSFIPRGASRGLIFHTKASLSRFL